ncbi:hypothetical protein JOF42_000343 [Microbacterium phyllosphaerae]|uniref:Uncharacterized protein n=1 Tax=Microbacterium phyllosphaerae TaxID=124798 RepID=A0ABS4WL37_9MICO|nr:hypothetical protein [Microbacterium phyllosphaerae]MBP2376848.1 hypothetical protein [Microbacterium phyllosphaerae]
MAKKKNLTTQVTLSNESAERIKIRVAARNTKRAASSKVTVSYGSVEALVGVPR